MKQKRKVADLQKSIRYCAQRLHALLLHVCSFWHSSTQRSWARTWEAGTPQEANAQERWWHTLIYSKYAPAMFHSSRPVHVHYALKAFQCICPPSQPRRRGGEGPRWRATHADQVWEKVSHLFIKKPRACVGSFYSLNLLPLRVWRSNEALAVSAHWVRRHCALVLMKIGQIFICSNFPSRLWKRDPPPLLSFFFYNL